MVWIYAAVSYAIFLGWLWWVNKTDHLVNAHLMVMNDDVYDVEGEEEL
jgi:hypothetical protein